MRRLLPFALLGWETDNDSVLMNGTVRDDCRAAGLAFTRCRRYRKNDQARVEQKVERKNGSAGRRSGGPSATGASRACEPRRCWREGMPACGCS